MNNNSTTAHQKQKNKRPYAIVIGLDDIRGLYAARTLSRNGVPVMGIATDPKSYGCKTKACNEIIFTNTKNQELISTLEVIGKKLNQKAVLFPCLDKSVLILSKYREKLEKYYHVVLPEHDTVEMLMDKKRFYEYAEKCNIPIPKTYYLNNKNDLEKACKSLEFPCLLKPSSSKTQKWLRQTHLKAFKISNINELFKTYEYYKEYTDCLIVQEWVEGSDECLYSCNCYFDSNAKQVVAFISKKIRQWPPQTGETCLGQECVDNVVLKESIRLFESVKFKGLGYVELKKDSRSGKYFIIEPNIGRPTARSAIAEASGIELLYTVYCDVLGTDLPNSLEIKHSGVKWIHLRRDLMSCFYYWRKGELSLRNWLKSYKGKKIYALFSLNDPAPFFSDLSRSLKLFLIPAERKKRDHRKLIKNS